LNEGFIAKELKKMLDLSQSVQNETDYVPTMLGALKDLLGNDKFWSHQ